MSAEWVSEGWESDDWTGVGSAAVRGARWGEGPWALADVAVARGKRSGVMEVSERTGGSESVSMGRSMAEDGAAVCQAGPDRGGAAARGLAFGGVGPTVRGLSFGAWQSLRVL